MDIPGNGAGESIEVDGKVVHQVNEVKVDNVYLYESQKDTQVIFKLRVLVKVLLEEL